MKIPRHPLQGAERPLVGGITDMNEVGLGTKLEIVVLRDVEDVVEAVRRRDSQLAVVCYLRVALDSLRFAPYAGAILGDPIQIIVCIDIVEISLFLVVCNRERG